MKKGRRPWYSQNKSRIGGLVLKADRCNWNRTYGTLPFFIITSLVRNDYFLKWIWMEALVPVPNKDRSLRNDSQYQQIKYLPYKVVSLTYTNIL